MSHRLLKEEMKLIRSALWSAKAVLSRRSHVIRSFSANPFSVPDDWDKLNSSGPVGESVQKNSYARIFSSSHSFYQELDKDEKAHDQSGLGSSFNAGNRSNNNGLYESYNPLADDLNYKLQKAASYFEFDPKEVISDTYSFRLDVNFMSGMTYDPKNMGADGVDGALIVQPINHKFHHSYVTSVLKQYPSKFVGCCLANPAEDGTGIKQLEDLISKNGYRAVRFNPYLWPSGELMTNEVGKAMFAKAGELGVPVGIMCMKGLDLHLSEIEEL